MNSNQTREARSIALAEVRIAAHNFNAALTGGRSTTRLGKILTAAEETHRFAQARHEQALRAEMTGATEAEIQKAARA